MVISINMGVEELLGYVNSKTHLTVIDFYADWCGPCRQAKPTYELLAGKFNSNEVKFLSCNVDTQRDCAQRFNITGMPTFLILHEGKELLRTHDVRELNKALDRHIMLVRRVPAAGRLGGPSLSPLIDKMVQLTQAKEDDVSTQQSLAESIRLLLVEDTYRQPFGLALLPYLASSEAGGYSGTALERLLHALSQKEILRAVAPHRAVASSLVNNVLRYVLQVSLSLTWNEREEIAVLHRILQSLLLSTTAQQLIVKSPYFFNPLLIQTGYDLEMQTVLGGLLGLGPMVRSTLLLQLPKQNPTRAFALESERHTEYAALQTIFPPDLKETHPNKVVEVQRIVDSLGMHNSELVSTLLRSKATREPTMWYFSESLRLNEGNQKIMNQNLPLSSVYFMTQVQHVLLASAKPIFDSFIATTRTTQRLPPHYVLYDTVGEGDAIVSFGKDVERVEHFDEENPLPEPPVHLPTTNSPNSNSRATSISTYKPLVHLFFLAVRATTVITVPLIESHSNLERQARHRSRDRMEGIVIALYRIREGLLGSSSASKLRLTFLNSLSRWLLDVMEIDPVSGELPATPPLAWRYLPQELVDAPVKATELTDMAAAPYTPELHGLLLVLMGNAVYFPKPHTHVFSYLLSRVLQEPAASAQFQRHPWFSRRIVRSCMNCYIAVEKAFYERSQVRFDLSKCLKTFLEVESLSAAVREEMCDPKSTSLERFSHMAVAELNEAVDQMTETLKKMNQKIKEGADTSPTPLPPPLPPASGSGARRPNITGQNGARRQAGPQGNSQRSTNNEESNNSEEEEEEEESSGPSYHQLGLSLHSYISLFFASTDLFISLARCFPSGVSQNMVAQQLSQVLARSLVTFAGRESGQLKIQNEKLYKFSPRDILARLVDCLTPLTSSDSFLRCLCECGVGKEDILYAIDNITSRNLVSNTHQVNLEVMKGAIISFSKEVEKENLLWDDAPDFALDALLSTPLTDPVALPAEVRDLDDLVYVNRDTIHHLLLSDSRHPFTKEFLDENMLNAFNQRPNIAAARENLKKRIEVWLQEAKAKMVS